MTGHIEKASIEKAINIAFIKVSLPFHLFHLNFDLNGSNRSILNICNRNSYKGIRLLLTSFISFQRDIVVPDEPTAPRRMKSSSC